MSTFGIVSDLHFHQWSNFAGKTTDGGNSRLEIQAQELLRAADKAIVAGSERLYVAGDIFHIRGSVSTEVINVASRTFSTITDSLGLEVRAIPGNHDLAGREAKWLGSTVSALGYAGVRCINEPTYFADDNVLMIPWIEPVKAVVEKLRELAKTHSGAIVILHAPLNGVIRGIPDHGLDPLDVSNLGFSHVYSGHYHNHKSFCNGKVVSIGALTHQTWSDVNAKAGFIIVNDDGKKHKLTHVSTTTPLFIDFDPKKPEQVEGNYVRYKVEGSTASEVAKYRAMLEQLGAAGVTITVVPKSQTGNRTATVQSGASLEQSITDFVANVDYQNKRELSRYCLELLEEVA